jgi:hypothetical protein
MPFDGSGNFTRDFNWVDDRNNGIKIIASRMDAEFNNYATGMNQVLLRNGVAPLTGNLNMGTHNIIALGSGVVGTPSIRFNSDAGTGIWSPAAGQVAFMAAGASRLVASAAGVTIIGTLDLGGDVELNNFKVTGLADGTAPLPAVSFLSDPTTGIYLTAPSQLSFSINGVERARLEPNGLNVYGNASVQGSVIANVVDTPIVRNGGGNLSLQYGLTEKILVYASGAVLRGAAVSTPISAQKAGLLISTDASAAGNQYSSIAFSATGGTPDNPHSRISNRTTAAGSYLHFGTSNNYDAGVTNNALIIDPNGQASFSNIVNFLSNTNRAFASGVGNSNTFTIDGILRWNWSVSPASGDMVYTAYNAASAPVATIVSYSLFNFSATFGNQTEVICTRDQQGIWGNGTAMRLNGYGPAITFRDRTGVASAVLGQYNAESTFAMMKGDGTPAAFYFNIATGVGTTTTWTSLSDSRLKYDIQPLATGLDTLAALQPLTYMQSVNEDDVAAEIGTFSAGVIAQDLIGTPLEGLVIPPAPDPYGGAGYYSFNYTGLTAWYIAAFKEVKTRLDDIEARLTLGGL